MRAAAAEERRRLALRSAVVGGWLFSAVAVLGALVLWAVRGLPELPLSFLHGPGSNVGVGLLALTYATVGAMLAMRRLTNLIGWLFLGTGTLLSLVLPLNLLVVDAVSTFRPVPPATLLVAWAVSSVVAPFAAGMAFIVSVVFPGDRRPGAWHGLVVVNALGFGLVALASAVNPGGLPWFPTLPNPIRVPERFGDAIRILQVVAVSIAVFGMLAVTASLPIRYRRSDPVLRVQLRWIIAAIAILPPTVAPLFIARYALGAPPEVGEALMILAAVGGCAFPIATAIAITRHHLFGIERLVERALVYVPLMAILAGLYAASVALFQRLFIAVTGTSSEITIVLSTLILASMFTPIRQALERFVDRRFNPKKPDPTLVAARGVGEPSLVPAAALMVDLKDATRLRETASATPGTVAGGARGVADAAPIPPPSTDGPTAEALVMLAERLAAIESRLARIEGTPVVVSASMSPSPEEEEEEAEELDALLGSPRSPDHAPLARELGARVPGEASPPADGRAHGSEGRSPASQPSLGS